MKKYTLGFLAAGLIGFAFEPVALANGRIVEPAPVGMPNCMEFPDAAACRAITEPKRNRFRPGRPWKGCQPGFIRTRGGCVELPRVVQPGHGSADVKRLVGRYVMMAMQQVRRELMSMLAKLRRDMTKLVQELRQPAADPQGGGEPPAEGQ